MTSITASGEKITFAITLNKRLVVSAFSLAVAFGAGVLCTYVYMKPYLMVVHQ